MPIPLNFLKAAGKAIVKYCGNTVGFGIAGDLLVELGVPIVEDIWDTWGKKKNDEQWRTEIEAIARAAAKDVVQQVADIVKEVAVGQPVESQQLLRAYLTQVPAMVQKSLRRPFDPKGRSVSANLVPRKAEDLLAFLPPKLPRFKPGDRPLPGVDWELEQLLGVGGFGEVWKARNPHFDSVDPVALKFCLDSKAKEQLLRHEAEILNQVRRQAKHPGIIKLLHTYLSADPPSLAYEYIEDGDLAGIIKEKKLKADIVAKIISRLAKIVGSAHRLNPPVVHRDLKPANILMHQTRDKKFVVKVADFGIGGLAATQAIGEVSRGTSRGRFMVSALQGAYTPLYASPQQMRGEAPDPRDDVFSLGVIWYQMLTGNLATGRPGGRRWRDKLAETVPSEMLDLLEACFEDDPDHRPVNAAEMAERLRSVRKHQDHEEAKRRQQIEDRQTANLERKHREQEYAEMKQREELRQQQEDVETHQKVELERIRRKREEADRQRNELQPLQIARGIPMSENLPEVRILPMDSESEFDGKSIEEVQQTYFLKELLRIDRPPGKYRYRKSGLDAKSGTIVLFQYDRKIIASATLIKVERFPTPENGTYHGALHFDVESIKVFDPVGAEAVTSIWPEFKRFSNVKQKLASRGLPEFERNLTSVRKPQL